MWHETCSQNVENINWKEQTYSRASQKPSLLAIHLVVKADFLKFQFKYYEPAHTKALRKHIIDPSMCSRMMSCFPYIIWQEFCLDSCQRFESILCNTTSSARHKMQHLTLSPVTSSWAWVSETLELRSSEWQCQAFCLANKRALCKLLCCCASKWWPKSFNLHALRGQAGQWHGGHPVPAALCPLILSEWMFIQHLCVQGAAGMGTVRWSSCLQRFRGGEVGQTQHSKINTELGACRAAVRIVWGLEAQGNLLGEKSTQIQSQTRKMKSQGGRCRSMAEVLEARGRFLLTALKTVPWIWGANGGRWGQRAGVISGSPQLNILDFQLSARVNSKGKPCDQLDRSGVKNLDSCWHNPGSVPLLVWEPLLFFTRGV